MPIATFRGEKSVAEIADKLFTKLSDPQREIAAAAILKANPRLTEISKIPKGTVLRVPDIPELRPRTNRDLDNPDAQIAKDINQALGDYDKRFASRIEQALDNNKAQAALLESAEFKRALNQNPELQQLSSQTAKAVATRSKTLPNRHKELAKAVKLLAQQLGS